MSQKTLDLENQKTILISPDDVVECEKFFQFFEIPPPAALSAAFEAFKSNPSITTQEELKFQLADVVAKGEHPVFQDEVFAQIRPETTDVRDELLFEKQMQEMLSEKTSSSSGEK